MIYDMLMFAGRHSVSITGIKQSLSEQLGSHITPQKINFRTKAQCETWGPTDNGVSFYINFIFTTPHKLQSRWPCMPRCTSGSKPLRALDTSFSITQEDFFVSLWWAAGEVCCVPKESVIYLKIINSVFYSLLIACFSTSCLTFISSWKSWLQG